MLDPATGQISVYDPLVVNAGTQPAVAPVVPTLPAGAVVALWFGYNGDTLTLAGADENLTATAAPTASAPADSAAPTDSATASASSSGTATPTDLGHADRTPGRPRRPTPGPARRRIPPHPRTPAAPPPRRRPPPRPRLTRAAPRRPGRRRPPSPASPWRPGQPGQSGQSGQSGRQGVRPVRGLRAAAARLLQLVGIAERHGHQRRLDRDGAPSPPLTGAYRVGVRVHGSRRRRRPRRARRCRRPSRRPPEPRRPTRPRAPRRTRPTAPPPRPSPTRSCSRPAAWRARTSAASSRRSPRSAPATRAAFFTAANAAISAGKLTVPSPGRATDGLACMTTRSFALIDQDQSDNVTTEYLSTGNGQTAQDTAANRGSLGRREHAVQRQRQRAARPVRRPGARLLPVAGAQPGRRRRARRPPCRSTRSRRPSGPGVTGAARPPSSRSTTR